MLADSLDRQLISILQRLLYIVGTQRSQWAYHLYIFLTKHQNIGISPEHHPEVAIKARYINIKELNQLLGHTYRTAARAAASMRSSERLVQIQMHNVKSHITGTHLTHQRIHIGAIIIEQTACLMNHICNLLYISLEQPQSIGIGHHYTCNRII